MFTCIHFKTSLYNKKHIGFKMFDIILVRIQKKKKKKTKQKQKRKTLKLLY